MERRLGTWPSRLAVRPWLVAFVPVNAATSGFGVALPLLILIPLGGTWTDVALAATLFNAALIVSSIFWGYVSDRYPTRRRLLLLNFAGFAAAYVLLARVTDLPALYALYTLIAVVAPAGASASNLLILEKFSEAERPAAYASFQEMSMIGSLAGLLLGYFWLEAHEALEPLLYLLAALAAASAVAVWVGVRDGPVAVRPVTVARHPEGLASRVSRSIAFRAWIPFFPRVPRLIPGAVARFRLWVREELHHELPLVLVAMFLFNLTSNLFNISYTPFLYSVGVSAASIFLVNFANNVTQSAVFPGSGTLTSRLGADWVVQRSTYVRGVGYLAVAGFTLVPMVSGAAFGANAIAFGVLGGAIAYYSTSSSIILFRTLAGRDAGTLLGLNSALGGVAAVAGAALAGVLSVLGSYRLTFFVSGIGLLASIPVWSAAKLASARRRPGKLPQAPANPPAPGVPGETS